MYSQNRQKKLHDFWRRRRLFVLGLAMTFAASLAAMERANALYILTGVSDSAIVLEEGTEVPDFSSQLVYVTTGSHGYDVTLAAGQTVTVHHQDVSLTVKSKKESISALLKRLDVEPSPLDMVAVDLSGDGATLTISDQLTYFDKVVEPVQYETQRVANPQLAKGTERVVQTGVNGVRTAIYEVIWAGGEEISRHCVEELDSSSVPEIVEYGTGVNTVTADDRVVNVTKNADGSGVLHFQSGATLKFTGMKSMTATAYTAGHGGVGTRTATGTTVHVGTVAVDKKVIPLGTRMYIVSEKGGVVYGMGVAEDTGVRGNHVDLYHETYQQCINFGRRPMNVYILE